jgi:subtilisin family serine protease
MKYIALIALLVCSAYAAPLMEMVPLSQEGDVIPGRFVVSAKKNVDVALVQALADSVSAEEFWHIKNEETADFVGFGGHFTDAIVESLRFRTDLLEIIEATQIFRTSARQSNPPSWGLGASSSASAQNPGYYDYPDHAGAGSTVYIIDTGIHCTHNDFNNPTRCVWGARYGQGGYADGNGHGTHCAGTAAGTSYGIAKKAQLVAVGVLGPTGSGSTNDVISGVNYSAGACTSNCVGSMSLGGGASTSLDNAVNAAVSSRYFMSVAAGNSNTNAQNTSPARAADAYTVMATDSAARKASYSNYGSVCQIWAPGSSITSTWSTSNSATNTISGTSMACPHVSGAGALAWASGRGSSSRTAIETYINSVATNNAISGVPSGTVNRFLRVSPTF